MPDEVDRFRGCLLGLAAGDAVGTTIEFCRPGTFSPINDMVGGGPFKRSHFATRSLAAANLVMTRIRPRLCVVSSLGPITVLVRYRRTGGTDLCCEMRSSDSPMIFAMRVAR